MLTVTETAALLRTFDNVLILTHVRPDGDTVGCAAALCAALRALGISIKQTEGFYIEIKREQPGV